MSFKAHPDWQWQMPEHFNIGAACTDKHLNTPQAELIAMIVEDEVHGTSSITFSALAHQTDQFAQLLINCGIKLGDRVLIRLPNSLAYPISFLGAMKSGAVSVPTSTLLTAEEVVYLAKNSDAAVLVTDRAAWGTFKNKISEAPNLKLVLLAGAGEIEKVAGLDVLDLMSELKDIIAPTPAYQTKANDPAYLVYTSGTTGYPKGVLHAHRAMIGREPASQYWFDFDESKQDRIVHSGKFNWTYVLGSGLMDPLYLGKTVIVYEGKNNPERWMQLIKKHAATIFVGVPTIYRQIIQKTKTVQRDVPSLRYCMSAGEHLSDEVMSQWRARFGMDIYEAVGMSEFSYYLSQNKFRPIRLGSAGFPQPGHAIKLLNPDTHQAVALGEEGMICIPEDDPGLFLKYWKLDEETAKHKHDGWFFTGDYARYDADGYIWFLGRKDDIINSFGYRVSPYEIERVYKSHEDVADCAAIGEVIGKDKVLVVCYVLLKSSTTVAADDLLAFGKKHLAAYKTPKTVYIAKDFPRTKNGKILRKEINPNIAVMKSAR